MLGFVHNKVDFATYRKLFLVVYIFCRGKQLTLKMPEQSLLTCCNLLPLSIKWAEGAEEPREGFGLS